MNDISVVQVDGKRYLGIVSEDKENGIVNVKHAMEFNGKAIDSGDIVNYLTESNLEDMPELNFKGNGTVSYRVLTKKEALQWKMLEDTFELGKGTAVRQLENDYFRKEVGN